MAIQTFPWTVPGHSSGHFSQYPIKHSCG